VVPWPQVERLATGQDLSPRDVQILSRAFLSMWAYLGLREDVPTRSIIVLSHRIKKPADNQQFVLAKALSRFLQALDHLPERDRQIWQAKHIEKLEPWEIWSIYMRLDSTPLTPTTVQHGTKNVARRLRRIYKKIAVLLTGDTKSGKIVYDRKDAKFTRPKKSKLESGEFRPFLIWWR